MTVRLIEAKESGRKAGMYLDSGEVDLSKITGYRQTQREHQVGDSGVQPELSGDEKHGDEKCRFCGKKGHGAKPSYSQKKEYCPAFDKNVTVVGILATSPELRPVRSRSKWRR